MTQLSQADIDGARRAAIEAMFKDDPGTTEAAAEFVDLKKLFCENWQTVKQVLQFIADKLGEPVRSIVKALIGAGDFLHELIC